MAIREAGHALGPKQLDWCKRKIPAFKEAWRQAQEAEVHAAKVRADLEKAAAQ